MYYIKLGFIYGPCLAGNRLGAAEMIVMIHLLHCFWYKNYIQLINIDAIIWEVDYPNLFRIDPKLFIDMYIFLANNISFIIIKKQDDWSVPFAARR